MAKNYKVKHSDGHNDDTVHVFRDRAQFVAWMSKRDDEFELDAFEDDGEFEDGNGDKWSEFTGLYERDHTKDPA